jgi:hypothetical protein
MPQSAEASLDWMSILGNQFVEELLSHPIGSVSQTMARSIARFVNEQQTSVSLRRNA